MMGPICRRWLALKATMTGLLSQQPVIFKGFAGEGC